MNSIFKSPKYHTFNTFPILFPIYLYLLGGFFILLPDEINISTLGAASTSSKVWLPGGGVLVYLISDETNRIGGAWNKEERGPGGWEGNEEGTL